MSDPRGVPTPHSGFQRVKQAGMASWSLLGVIFLAAVIMGGLSAMSGVVIPLVIAFIIGTVLDPLTSTLHRRGVPANVSAVAGIFVALAVVVLIGVIIVFGFVQQLAEIVQRAGQGWVHLMSLARSLDLDTAQLEQIRNTAYEYVPFVTQGVVGLVTHTLFGLVSFAMGLFFSMFFLFFVVRDSDQFPGWLARVTEWDSDLVTEIYGLSKDSIRGYLKGTAVTAIITAPIFMIPLLILQVPLALPIFILYFFLSFIPFLGAWITGAFAVLIALSSGGVGAALIVLLCLIISNGSIQSTVNSWALGSSLKLHPVAVLIATMVGGSLAGILGMVLGPPVLSAMERGIRAARSRNGTTTNVDPVVADQD